MLSAAGQVRLTEDVTIPEISFESGKTYDIDLNGNVLLLKSDTTEVPFVVPEGSTITLSNGELNLDINLPSSDKAAISVEKGGTFTLDNVDYSTEMTGILIDDDSSALNILDSSITTEKGYAVGTNASGNPVDLVINIRGSELLAKQCCALLFNINGTLNISDSYIEAGAQAVIVRGGTANITDSVLYTNCEDPYTAYEPYFESNWKTGNALQYGTLIMGNTTTGYDYPTTVTVDNNTRISIKEGPMPAVYAAASNNQPVTIIIPDTYAGMLKQDGNHYFASATDSITVNGVPIQNDYSAHP